MSLYTDQARYFIPNNDKVFFFPLKLSTAALRSTQLFIQWVLKALSLGINWPRYSDDHSPPFGAKVRLHGAIPPLSHTPSWCGA
jgi:hypothetical protein